MGIMEDRTGPSLVRSTSVSSTSPNSVRLNQAGSRLPKVDPKVKRTDSGARLPTVESQFLLLSNFLTCVTLEELLNLSKFPHL